MSPTTQGRSVREFEEQMAALRKENFNLKLRLYFIEESLPGFQQNNGADAQESAMREVIETKVQMEIFRKELEEKQDLLKDAAVALNQMEQLQKDAEVKYQSIIDELQQKVHYLEMENEIEKSGRTHLEYINHQDARTELSEDSNDLQKICELENWRQNAAERENQLKENISTLNKELAKRDEMIKRFEENIKKLSFQNEELLEAIESKDKVMDANKSKNSGDELQKLKIELANKTCMLEECNEKLENRSKIHEQALKTIQKLVMNIKKQEDEIRKLKNQISNEKSLINETKSKQEAESDDAARSLSDSEAFGSGRADAEKKALKSKIEEQDKTIQSLRAEIKKKTSNLQTLVNKELWEKNREIERLVKVVNQSNADGSFSINDLDEAAVKSSADADMSKYVEHNKMLQRKVEVLSSRLNVERNNEVVILQLRKDLRSAEADLHNAEKWRQECTNVCSILSNRLEELAGFLKSLLKHKDVLGVLAADSRYAIRKAVDKSLDLSKNLNMTLSLSNISICDQSLAELNNLSQLLVDGGLDVENKTFNSHSEIEVDEKMQKLQEENKALKKELDKRRSGDLKKDRRSLPLLVADNQSESEAWSEPDRKVSMARIGLDTSLQNASTNVKDTKIQHTDSDTESESANQKNMPKTRTQEQAEQLERLLSQRDERILEIQCKLVESDNRLKKEHLRVIDLTQEVEQLRQRNEELFTDLVAIGGEKDASIIKHDSSMLKDLEKKTRALEKLAEHRDRILIELRFSEMKVNTLKTEMEELKRKHQKSLDLVSEKAKLDLEQQKNEMNVILEQRLRKQELEYNEELSRKWIARDLYDGIREKAVDLQRQLLEAEHTIELLNANEMELKESIEAQTLSVRVLEKQIDESTMKISKVLMECNRAENAKVELGQNVEKLEQKLSAKSNECEQLKLRIRELEKQLAALKERAVQTMPSTVEQSGYTSEELPLNNCKHNANVCNAERENRIASTSPDLGIESDAGRISGIETANTQRALLKIVELPPTIINDPTNNVPQRDSSHVKEYNSDDEENVAPNIQQGSSDAKTIPTVHDCAKVDQENAELKRKLNHTKRALEDTYQKLRLVNQRKARVEKDIKNQILKTHNVLKNVKNNMENEL